MTSNELPILRLNECQSFEEPQAQHSRPRIRSHSLNPDIKTVRKVMLNNCIPEVHSLNNRLDQLVKKYRNCNTSYFASQTLDEIKSAYQTQFGIWNAKLEKVMEEKTALKLVNDSLNDKLATLEKNMVHVKKEFESSLTSLKFQLTENIEKYSNSMKDWQNLEAKYLSEKDEIKSQLVNEKKKSAYLENKISILEDKIKFQESILDKEVEEYKRISELKHKTIENKIRAELDSEFEVYKEELLQKTAEEKSLLNENLSRYHNSKISQMESDIKSAKRRKETVESELRDEKKKNEALSEENRKLKNTNRKNMEQLEQEIKVKSDANKMLTEEMELLRKEFEQEIEEKIGLEKEIRKYKKIIEDAERHMNITPNSTSSPSTNNSPQVNNVQQQDHGVISPIVSSSLIDSSENESSRKRRRLQIDIQTDPHIVYKNGKFLVEYNDKDRIQREDNVQNEQGLSFFFNFLKKK